jgi:hypothetical protein
MKRSLRIAVAVAAAAIAMGVLSLFLYCLANAPVGGETGTAQVQVTILGPDAIARYVLQVLIIGLIAGVIMYAVLPSQREKIR